MNIYIDNIIFSIQKHGGISVVWYELLKRMLEDDDIKLKFLEFQNQNVVGKQLLIPETGFVQNNLSQLPLNLQRYLNPNIKASKGIFHSTYLRTCVNPKLLNITTIHDFTYEYFSKGLPKYVHYWQKRNAVNNSSKIICVSQNTKADLLKFNPQINESNIYVIYNGVSDSYFKINGGGGDEISLIPFKKNDYVLFVGDRRSEYKNFKMTVNACQIAKVPLVIIGGGEITKFEKDLLNLCLGNSNYCNLIGVSNEKLNVLYNNAAFLIYPSIYEGFGIPVVEAQKAGCPVICSNKSSLPEVANNAAFILEDISANKIAEILITNKSRSIELESIIDAGLINAKRFSWDECYTKTKEVYVDAYNSI